MPDVSQLWLAALCYNAPYSAEDGVAAAISAALTVDGAAAAGHTGALVLRWDHEDSRPRYHAVPDDCDEKDLLELIFATTFLLPLLEAHSSSSPANPASSPLEALGIDYVFTNKMRDILVPNTWALLVLATVDQIDTIIDSIPERHSARRIATMLSGSRSASQR